MQPTASNLFSHRKVTTNKFWLILFCTLLASCSATHAPLPEGYKGNTATITDTFRNRSSASADFYFIEAIDGKDIHNAVQESSSASHNQGPRLTALGHQRTVPAIPATYTISAMVYHAAPITHILNIGSNFSVKGNITFTPEKDTRYLVKGKLTETHSAVWIEDSRGNIVSDVVEVVAEGEPVVVDAGNMQQEINATKPTSPEEIFIALSGGESSEMVVQKLGKPNLVTRQRSSVFSGTKQLVLYHYWALGEVEFAHNIGPGLSVSQIRKYQFANPEYDFPQAKLELQSASGQTLQQLAKEYHRMFITEEAPLDLIATKIWQERNSPDEIQADGIAWLCKVLGKSRKARYKTLLTEVAQVSESRKIRRHAEKSLALFTKVREAAQFEYKQ